MLQEILDKTQEHSESEDEDQNDDDEDDEAEEEQEDKARYHTHRRRLYNCTIQGLETVYCYCSSIAVVLQKYCSSTVVQCYTTEMYYVLQYYCSHPCQNYCTVLLQ